MFRLNSPYVIFGLLSFIVTLSFFGFFHFFLPFGTLVAFLLSINIVTFLLYGYDKFSAKHGWTRVPEWNLHTLDILGGTLAGLFAQQFFRHKTNDASFRPIYITIFVLQALFLVWYFFL